MSGNYHRGMRKDRGHPGREFGADGVGQQQRRLSCFKRKSEVLGMARQEL